MSEIQGDNMTPNQPENNNGEKARGKGERLLAWAKKNSGNLALMTGVVLLVVLFVLLPDKPRTEHRPPNILGFVALSYVILMVGLFAIWFLVDTPFHCKQDMDLESLLRARIQGTVAILGMITLLAIGALAAWTVAQPDRAAGNEWGDVSHSYGQWRSP